MNRLRDIAISVVCLTILAAILFPVFAQTKGGGKDGCISNAKQMARGLVMYTTDFNDRLPDRDRWMDAEFPYVSTSRPSIADSPSRPTAMPSMPLWIRRRPRGFPNRRKSRRFTTRSTRSAAMPRTPLSACLCRDGIWGATPSAISTATRGG